MPAEHQEAPQPPQQHRKCGFSPHCCLTLLLHSRLFQDGKSIYKSLFSSHTADMASGQRYCLLLLRGLCNYFSYNSVKTNGRWETSAPEPTDSCRTLSPAISKLPLKFISNVISQDIPNCKQWAECYCPKWKVGNNNSPDIRDINFLKISEDIYVKCRKLEIPLTFSSFGRHFWHFHLFKDEVHFTLCLPLPTGFVSKS